MKTTKTTKQSEKIAKQLAKIEKQYKEQVAIEEALEAAKRKVEQEEYYRLHPEEFPLRWNDSTLGFNFWTHSGFVDSFEVNSISHIAFGEYFVGDKKYKQLVMTMYQSASEILVQKWDKDNENLFFIENELFSKRFKVELDSVETKMGVKEDSGLSGPILSVVKFNVIDTAITFK